MRETGDDAPEDRAISRAWLSARLAGLFAAIVGGLGTLLVGGTLVMLLAAPYMGFRERATAASILLLIVASFGTQLVVGIFLQGRSATAQRNVVRRLWILGAAGIVPLLMGLYAVAASVMSVVMMGSFGPARGPELILMLVVVIGMGVGIGGSLIAVNVWPWWTLLRHKAWLNYLAAVPQSR